MEDDLKMKGSTPLNLAIFAFGCLVFGGTMYGLTRSSADQKENHALEQASQQAKAADPSATASKPEGQGEFAKMEASAPEGNAPAMSTTVPAGEPSAANQTPVPPADPAVGAGSMGGTPPPSEPRAANEPETPPETSMANAAPVEPAAAASSTSAPEAVTTAAASETPAAGTKQELAKADDEPNPPVKESPKPSAMGVLSPWWQASQASPFNVQFVGRSVDEKKIVILFNQDIDPAAANGKIRVLDGKGRPVASNWQPGGNPRVLVNGDLKPGRYLVVIEPTLAGAQGQPVGVAMHGPVVLQPDSQAS